MITTNCPFNSYALRANLLFLLHSLHAYEHLLHSLYYRYCMPGKLIVLPIMIMCVLLLTSSAVCFLAKKFSSRVPFCTIVESGRNCTIYKVVENQRVRGFSKGKTNTKISAISG